MCYVLRIGCLRRPVGSVRPSQRPGVLFPSYVLSQIGVLVECRLRNRVDMSALLAEITLPGCRPDGRWRRLRGRVLRVAGQMYFTPGSLPALSVARRTSLTPSIVAVVGLVRLADVDAAPLFVEQSARMPAHRGAWSRRPSSSSSMARSRRISRISQSGAILGLPSSVL